MTIDDIEPDSQPDPAYEFGPDVIVYDTDRDPYYAAMSDDELRQAVAGGEAWREVYRRHPVMQGLYAAYLAASRAADRDLDILNFSVEMPPAARAVWDVLRWWCDKWLHQQDIFAPGGEDMITRDEVAGIWGVRPATVSAYVNRKILPMPTAGRWRRAEVVQALAHRRPPGRPRGESGDQANPLPQRGP